MTSRINPEILEVQEELRENGLKAFLYDFEMSMKNVPREEMDKRIKEQGIPSSNECYWKKLLLMGELEAMGEDSEKIIRTLKEFYIKRGFGLVGASRLINKISFEGESGNRGISYYPDSDSTLLFFYNNIL